MGTYLTAYFIKSELASSFFQVVLILITENCLFSTAYKNIFITRINSFFFVILKSVCFRVVYLFLLFFV